VITSQILDVRASQLGGQVGESLDSYGLVDIEKGSYLC
jgi:hypothetical protein